jgi:hypothetical protein
MVFRAAYSYRWCNQGVAHSLGYFFSKLCAMLGIDEQGQMWAMLLHGSTGNHGGCHTSVQSSLDLRPTHVFEN